MKNCKKDVSVLKKDYWFDVAAVSVLIALSIIVGGINFISGDGDSLTFANVFSSLIYLAVWAFWGCTVLPRRRETHPVRIFYTAWFALGAIAALSLLIISLAASGGASFMTSEAGSKATLVLFLMCSPMYGVCFFGSDGYILNDIFMLMLSLVLILMPYIVQRAIVKKELKK